MASAGGEVIRQRIAALCERGVLRGFSETQSAAGKVLFRFRWLMGREFCLEYCPAKQLLRMKDILPAIEYRSFMDRDLRQFVAHRSAAELPEHRRRHADKVSLSYRNRKQQVSLEMRAGKGHQAYAINALLSVVNELFRHLNLYHVPYLNRHFDLPEE